MPVMPDTRIPLSSVSEGGQQSSPFQTLGALMQMKEHQQLYQQRQREAEKQRQVQEEDDLVSRVVPMFGKPEDALEELRQAGPVGARASIRYGQKLYEMRKSELEAQDSELKTADSRLGHAGQVASSVTDQTSWDTALPVLKKTLTPLYGDKIVDLLPTVYDKAKVAALVTAGTNRQLQIQMQRDKLTAANQAYDAGLIDQGEYRQQYDPSYVPTEEDRKVKIYSPNGMKAQQAQREFLGRELQNAESGEDWDRILSTANARGVSTAVANEFDALGGWSPTARDKARNLALTVAERAQLENQAAGAATRAAQAETAAEREARLLAAANAARTGGGQSGGGPTAAQSRAWAEQSKIEDDITKVEEWAAEQVPSPPSKPGSTAPGEWPKEQQGKSGYQLMPPSAQKEYIRRRVDLENRSRTRTQNLPTIEQAAKAAVAAGDQEGYNKLNETYSAITQGLGKLEDIVKWKGPTKSATTNAPASQGPSRGGGPAPDLTPQVIAAMPPAVKQELAGIIQQLQDPNIPAPMRRTLELRRDALASGR